MKGRISFSLKGQALYLINIQEGIPVRADFWGRGSVRRTPTPDLFLVFLDKLQELLFEPYKGDPLLPLGSSPEVIVEFFDGSLLYKWVLTYKDDLPEDHLFIEDRDFFDFEVLQDLREKNPHEPLLRYFFRANPVEDLDPIFQFISSLKFVLPKQIDMRWEFPKGHLVWEVLEVMLQKKMVTKEVGIDFRTELPLLQLQGMKYKKGGYTHLYPSYSFWISTFPLALRIAELVSYQKRQEELGRKGNLYLFAFRPSFVSFKHLADYLLSHSITLIAI